MTALGPSARAFLFGAVVAASLGARTAHAAPQDLFGLGARSSSMGMTAAASSQDYESIYGNPGLLAETREKSLTLGIGIARHALRADVPGAPLTLPTDEMRTIYIGAALPIPFGGALKDRVTFGVAFLDPAKVLIRGKILYPERLQYPILAPRVQSLAVSIGIGARIGERVYLGVGFEALAALVGEIDIRLDATGRVGSRTDDQVVAAYAPILGLAIDMSSHWRVGLTYRGELVGRFAVLIKAQDLGINLPDFNVAGIAQYIPEQLALEARWSSETKDSKATMPGLRKGTEVAGGILVRRWSAYPGPNEPTVLENTTYGTGSPPINASDTVSPRVGLEHAIPITARATVKLRAGYAFEPSPLPVAHQKENFLDGARHVLTAGFGLAGDEKLPFQIDLFAQYHQLVTRENTKDATVTPGMTGYPSVTSGGNIVVIGATVGVRF